MGPRRDVSPSRKATFPMPSAFTFPRSTCHKSGVDRLLTQWILAGKFKGLKALILGDFRGIRNQKIYDILASQMALNVPVVHCPYIGHVANKITLPIGTRVELNTDKKQLVIRKMSFPGRNP